jgi:hypothetical protein
MVCLARHPTDEVRLFLRGLPFEVTEVEEQSARHNTAIHLLKTVQRLDRQGGQSEQTVLVLFHDHCQMPDLVIEAPLVDPTIEEEGDIW